MFNFKWYLGLMAYFTFYGGDSSSSSASTATTTTNNIDRRQVVDAGGFGLASDHATISVTNTSLDAGVVNKALDVVSASDATQGASFTQLLNMADKMFNGAGQIISKAQDTTLAQIGQIASTATSVQNDKTGAVNQKTLIILAVAGVGALYFGHKK